MMKFIKSKKALSLIETLVYIAVLGVVFLAVMQLSFSVADTNRITEEKLGLNQNTIFITEHIKDSFKKSATIDTTNSIFSNDLGKIRLNKTGGYVEYRVDSGRILFDENGTTTTYISSLKFAISKFRFEAITNKDATANVGAKIWVTIYDIKKPNLYQTIETAFLVNE